MQGLAEVSSPDQQNHNFGSAPGVDHSPALVSDDLEREVYCVCGMPIDAIEMPAVLHRIAQAAAEGRRYLISTPNLNYLVNSQADAEFRESLLLSDLCPADGIPIVWISRLLGLPIKKRVAGSDVFEALKSKSRSGTMLKAFLFGSTEPIAAEAAKRLSADGIGVKCVGWLCPGFGDVSEFSKDKFIDEINASGADLLVAALSAKKGQIWLYQNHFRLRIPVRTHLGATINFQAGSLKRSPLVLQRLGLEWLWRIKEEPKLFKRYWNDGRVLFRVLVVQILPIFLSLRWRRLRASSTRHDFVIVSSEKGTPLTVSISGDASAESVAAATSSFRKALEAGKAIRIDLSRTRTLDARFFGLLLMLRKRLRLLGFPLSFVGLSPKLERESSAGMD
jgi:N-acetylglucosaminyldiphosphoundecaprenol N-acetyl-beta-D-mannosaminyltransferase